MSYPYRHLLKKKKIILSKYAISLLFLFFYIKEINILTFDFCSAMIVLYQASQVKLSIKSFMQAWFKSQISYLRIKKFTR